MNHRGMYKPCHRWQQIITKLLIPFISSKSKPLTHEIANHRLLIKRFLSIKTYTQKLSTAQPYGDSYGKSNEKIALKICEKFGRLKKT